MAGPRYADFFKYAVARHQIYHARCAGKPREQWTDDPIFQQYRFTNVFRELDKTTLWFANNVREPLRHRPEVLLATMVFRMFNRIEVGEAIFCQTGDTLKGSNAFSTFVDTRDTRHMRRAIINFVGKKGPHATGAYIISSPPGYSKLDGILKLLETANGIEVGGLGWRQVAAICSVGPMTLQAVFDWLSGVPYFGKFHSYEIVTDLRHTALLDRAPDINTWANVGPGAARGLARIHGRAITERGKLAERVPVPQMLDEMREILRRSRDAKHWPQPSKRSLGGPQVVVDWPRWELRDVEHTLCEYDKYCRVREGQGAPRGVYR